MPRNRRRILIASSGGIGHLIRRSAGNMIPKQEEYRQLRIAAPLAANSQALRSELLGRLAKYAVSELRRLGWSDGALCCWCTIDGFESYRPEVSQWMQRGGFRDLLLQIAKIEKLAKIAQKRPRVIRSISSITINLGGPSAVFIQALRATVLESTVEFRSPQILAEKERRETEDARRIAAARESEHLVYRKPLQDDGTHMVRRPWV